MGLVELVPPRFEFERVAKPSKFYVVNPTTTVTANGQEIAVQLPCTIEEFLVAQKLLPRSVVVEHNGDAVAPSEFSNRTVKAGDRLEIVKIVAGG